MQHKEILKNAFNIFFTVVVIGFGVVSYWRGTWIILDLYVYPEDKKKSGWTCLLAGELLLLITFPIHLQLKKFSSQIKNLPRLMRWSFAAVERLWTYVVGFGVVLVWRGIWYLWDVFVLTDNLEASAWTAHAVGVGLLLVCGSLRSIIAPPALTLDDGKEDAFDYPMWTLPANMPTSVRSIKVTPVTPIEDNQL